MSTEVKQVRHRALPLPKGVHPWRVNFQYLTVIGMVHLLCLLAVLPWFFSWAGVASLVIGYFLFGLLGMSVGYHRLLCHRSFDCAKWFEYVLAFLGICCVQESPIWWVAVHRRHHLHADVPEDPHSPLAGKLWSHVGWLLLVNRDHLHKTTYHQYARDLARQPFYLWTDNRLVLGLIFAAQMLIFFLIGFGLAWFPHGDVMSGVRIGSSMIVWGVFLRVAIVMHGAWCIGSILHFWGYRNYELPDDSRNNWFLGFFFFGEGWHNNHHASSSSARFGHRWWEFDLGYLAIRFLQKLGLARNVVSHSNASHGRVVDSTS